MNLYVRNGSFGYVAVQFFAWAGRVLDLLAALLGIAGTALAVHEALHVGTRALDDRAFCVGIACVAVAAAVALVACAADRTISFMLSLFGETAAPGGEPS